MAKKTRVQIPPDTAAEVQFLADRTCCVCNVKGKPFQIHHIDEDPSNNDSANLAVLCLECHDETMIKGGFGRKLNADQVIKYRDDWNERVKRRREAAVNVSESVIPPEDENEEDDNPTQDELPNQAHLIAYLNLLPNLKREAHRRVEKKFAGSTMEMKEACYEIIDVMELVLVTLAGWYPLGHCGQRDVKQFINTLISDKYAWNRFVCEPLGGGTGGTIVGIDVAGSVLDELDEMVSRMGTSLCENLMEPDSDEWRERWKAAGNQPED
ncbi:MAG: hypothetical protein ACI8UO_003742 [Verrucomicrobiales bacterium]|jgi:hypothetical protein